MELFEKFDPEIFEYIKEIASNNGDISDFVHPAVLKDIEERFKKRKD